MTLLSAELLINTGSRRSREAMPEVLKSLEKHGFDITHTHTVGPGIELAAVAEDIRSRRPQLLIIGSGDGTISEVIDHFVGTDIELGIIPLGTTNNFARSLNLPLEIDRAVEIIRSQPGKQVDLGKINNDYFTNVASVGISAKVAQHVTSASKKRWGRMAYALEGARQLIRHKPFMVTLEDKDHELQLNFETHQVIIANGRYHAGRQIATDAALDSRELIIFALGGRSKLAFIWHTVDFYLGKRKQVAHTSYLIGKNVRLKTSTAQPVELDGEAKHTTPLYVEVSPQAVKVRHAP